ncbi:hypothetical protein GCM10009839_69430 [Catenulispora yoronensis]|uniref:Transposase for insertion sequence element IS21-like C-terminal domain-containing protein n=1 Tax=Catenulispora yoronensis TaxID=450799 RepID=A0ABP5GRW7_9ACTN
MEILAAYDLTGSYRKAAELAGCDHHTVRRYVQLRGTGIDSSTRIPCAKVIDAFMPEVEELIEASRGRIGADQVHKKLVAMGCDGTNRTPAARWPRRRSPTRPGTARRACGGVPTYCLTDNEKTVTTAHIANIAVRNPGIVPIGRFYSTVIRTCMPADPASKGGVENTVKIAKRDIVPTTTNLRGSYVSFGEIEVACDAFMAEVNGRVHRETRRIPLEMLGEERFRLHQVPEHPYTQAFGTTRQVHDKDSTIRVEQVRYSVSHQHADRQVFVRWHGDELVVTGIVDGTPAKIARHHRSTPGNPVILDEHYPESARGARTPKPTNAAEEAFLAIGPGAAS